MYVRILTLFSGVVMLFLSSCHQMVHAETHQPPIKLTVKLTSIKIEKTSDRTQDKIYFAITEYSNTGRSRESRIPFQPEYWLSQNIKQVKDLVLWQGDIQQGEEVKLVLSLLEQDIPPWNPDDLIGSAELVVKNEKGTLHTEWKIPAYEEIIETEMKPNSKKKGLQEFVFKGAEAHYEVAFDVQNQ